MQITLRRCRAAAPRQSSPCGVQLGTFCQAQGKSWSATLPSVLEVMHTLRGTESVFPPHVSELQLVSHYQVAQDDLDTLFLRIFYHRGFASHITKLHLAGDLNNEEMNGMILRVDMSGSSLPACRELDLMGTLISGALQAPQLMRLSLHSFAGLDGSMFGDCKLLQELTLVSSEEGVDLRGCCFDHITYVYIEAEFLVEDGMLAGLKPGQLGFFGLTVADCARSVSDLGSLLSHPFSSTFMKVNGAGLCCNLQR